MYTKRFRPRRTGSILYTNFLPSFLSLSFSLNLWSISSDLFISFLIYFWPFSFLIYVFSDYLLPVPFFSQLDLSVLAVLMLKQGNRWMNYPFHPIRMSSMVSGIQMVTWLMVSLYLTKCAL